LSHPDERPDPVSGSAAAPVAPAAAAELFAADPAGAQRYAELLATVGIERGLLGPREVPRLWERHLLNCAALGELVPIGARIVDVGSGAGLPGIPLALARPDLRLDLVESLARRTTFLDEVCAELGLSDRVRVLRGRAEDRETARLVGSAGWVTARAVAPLARLVRWCLPLLRPDGCLLAIKGESVVEEVERDRATLRAAGAGPVTVREIGSRYGASTWVAIVPRMASIRTRSK
jgi:16S rRNA (guanine527-N7)-methyltransferase